jgi:hypothetical protein
MGLARRNSAFIRKLKFDIPQRLKHEFVRAQIQPFGDLLFRNRVGSHHQNGRVGLLADPSAHFHTVQKRSATSSTMRSGAFS